MPVRLVLGRLAADDRIAARLRKQPVPGEGHVFRRLLEHDVQVDVAFAFLREVGALRSAVPFFGAIARLLGPQIDG